MRDIIKTQIKTILESAIKNYGEDTASNLIEILHKDYQDFLSWDINNGQNILIFALLNNLRNTVKKLLTQFYDLNLLTQEDLDKRNFIWHAFNRDEQAIIKPIVDRLCQENYHEILLKADNNNNTLLHCSSKRDSKLLPYLLDKIHPMYLKYWINQSNILGDTPLHMAIMHNSFRTIPLLINHGAHLLLGNNEGKTPADLLVELSKNNAAVFLQILTKINQDRRLTLIQRLREDLINYPSGDKIKNYFKANGLCGLHHLLLAHHEFNPKIPLRDHYKHQRPKQMIINESGIYQTINTNPIEELEYKLEDYILEKMPLYAERSGFLLFKKFENVSPNEIDLLNQDKVDLTNLLKIMDYFLQKCDQRKPVYDEHQFLKNLLAVSLLSLSALTICLLPFKELFIGIVFLMPLACAGLSIAITAFVHFKSLKTQKSFDELLMTLGKIISKLDFLDEVPRDNLINPAEFRNLKNSYEQFKASKLNRENMALVLETKYQISNLLKNLNRVQQPISSRFFQAKVSDRNNNDHIIDMNEEEQPLLLHARS